MIAARVFGGLTAAYGLSALLTAAPLTRHGELGDPDDPPPAAKLLSTTFGVRDVVSGLTILTAPPGRPLRLALAARIAFDAGDAIGFAALGPTAKARAKIGGIAGAWAVIGMGIMIAGLDTPDG